MSDLPQLNQFHEPVKLFALVVQSTTDIRQPFIDRNSLLLAVGFNRFVLVGKVRLLRDTS
jgi:hypothetical protein